ncbi:hypothetical protein [uncultured Desulfovibrio sp.]|nr:hypothetical protein [uncultured Desulfovibrio sp.]
MRKAKPLFAAFAVRQINVSQTFLVERAGDMAFFFFQEMLNGF